MRTIVGLVFVSLLLVPFASADSFTVDPSLMFGSWQIGYYSPAQSFTATGNRLVSFGFYIPDMNTTFAPTDYTVTATLLDGDGLSGAVLATTTLQFNSTMDRKVTWVDFGFAGAPELVPGQRYTVQLSNDTVRWGIAMGPPTGDPYAGGRLYLATPDLALFYASDTQADTIFRVVTTPEPASIALLASGLFALGGSRRRLRLHAAKEVIK